jgi:hypothetical protein
MRARCGKKHWKRDLFTPGEPDPWADDLAMPITTKPGVPPLHGSLVDLAFDITDDRTTREFGLAGGAQLQLAFGAMTGFDDRKGPASH